jgi:hypothetical protein
MRVAMCEGIAAFSIQYHYAQSHIWLCSLSVILLSVVMLSVGAYFMYVSTILSITTFSIMLSVVILSVLAPYMCGATTLSNATFIATTTKHRRFDQF